jgi:hypothetical protein
MVWGFIWMIIWHSYFAMLSKIKYKQKKIKLRRYEKKYLKYESVNQWRLKVFTTDNKRCILREIKFGKYVYLIRNTNERIN